MQGLLRELLGLLGPDHPLRRDTLIAYAEDLAERNMSEDAAVAYLAAGDRAKALGNTTVQGLGKWPSL